MQMSMQIAQAFFFRGNENIYSNVRSFLFPWKQGKENRGIMKFNNLKFRVNSIILQP